MPLYIKDDASALLVAEVADLRQLSKQDAVKQAVLAELSKLSVEIPLLERLARLRAVDPLPPRSDNPADEAFFDEPSGDL